MHPAISILKQTRKLLYWSVRNLTEEQFLAIPDGFDNNIAWNVGHIISVQQGITYSLCGLPPYISKEMIAAFKSGTSPADWTTPPTLAEFKPMLKEHPNRLIEDYEAGKFANYQPYKTSTGIKLETFDEALGFNNYHEGLHLGTILALRNFVVTD